VRGRQALGTLDRLTDEVAQRAKQTVREAQRLARSARRRARRKRVSLALLEQLERELKAAEQILAQTDLRLGGQRTIPDRHISLVDPDARPIRMGSPRRPTEFGYKALVADTAEGFVIAGVPERGGPVDASLLDKARAPSEYLADIRDVRGEGALNEILDSHLLPNEAGSGLFEDDYDRFVLSRLELVMDQIYAVTDRQVSRDEFKFADADSEATAAS
jgi:hypothetical protein